jgi:superfamily II DNA or RNA helicase
LRVPALVIVHKEFLMSQWEERLSQFLPEARVGIVQQDRCDFEGKHVLLAMIHSLAGRHYSDGLYKHAGA